MKTFFRKIAKLQEDLEKELELIPENTGDLISSGETALLKIDEAIRSVKKLVKGTTFESIADEVYFFKDVKPFFISRYIFYSNQIRIESLKPSGSEKVLKKYYTGELHRLKRYYAENSELYNYYRRNATYLDHKYFTRKSFDLKMNLPTSLYDFDEDFTTSHDHKVSVLLGYEILEAYLLEAINGISNPPIADKKFKISWTSSKVSLIELMYALHLTQCLNGGNIDFSEMVRWAEKAFDIDLGNFYKTVGEIKSRKYNTTKFLQLLTENLNKAFIEE
ncbi:RteC domain-containing protein [Chryseobacterium sp. ISL-6]|uniref:RteC domain-containing protein n=1 Tax=Chryseobacterium sp. ISL-6 TaxID=2819143 RepID=UPI001BEA752C|nr:RteC domain-containing protein [Chryseobacterium sp. ISL-6]MBT2620124.1 RteC domain-containing protein [Chryseobacterium sp. ISL-6]